MSGGLKQPYFSVIIPVYNVIEYFDACMDSILGQTYSQFEVVLVDDGSTDGSDKLCDRYSSEYNNVSVIHKTNGGQSSARNIGVKQAKGQYFIFVDSDDYIAVNTLEMFKNTIDEMGQVDVILCETMYNVENDGTINAEGDKLDSKDYRGINGEKALGMMYETIPDWSPCGKCYRTDYWRKKGFSFIEGRISEDLQLIDRVILEAEKVSMVPAHYYYRFKNESSTMHANFEKLVGDTIFVLDDWNNYLLEKKFNDELDFVIRKSMANLLKHIVMGNVYYVSNPKRKELLDSISNCLYYLKYDDSMEGKLIRKAINIIGLDNTCHVLNIIKSWRKTKSGIRPQ